MSLFGPPPELLREQQAKARDREYEARKTLIDGIAQASLNPAPNPLVGKILRAAKPAQIKALRNHLVERQKYWESMTARIEAANVGRAIQALDEGRYDYGHIGANLEGLSIGDLLGKG